MRTAGRPRAPPDGSSRLLYLCFLSDVAPMVIVPIMDFAFENLWHLGGSLNPFFLPEVVFVGSSLRRII